MNAAQIVGLLLEQEEGSVEEIEHLAAALNLHFVPANFPGINSLWQFTYLGSGPAEGASFYTRVGATPEEIKQRLYQKVRDFEEEAKNRQMAVGESRSRCECGDPECPACHGHCSRRARVNLVRVDMDDRTGTQFCSVCAYDAMQSGLFRPSIRNFVNATRR